jgi:hypothetical protein
MRVDMLIDEHHKYLTEKYEHLYNLKFPWAVNELRDALVRDHIRRVCEEIDAEKYLREVRDMGIAAAPIDVPQK